MSDDLLVDCHDLGISFPEITERRIIVNNRKTGITLATCKDGAYHFFALSKNEAAHLAQLLTADPEQEQAETSNQPPAAA